MLKAIGEGISTSAQPLKMPGGIEVGARMTAVQLADGGLVLHSPISLGSELRAEVEALGAPRAIVAPNKMHWLFLREAAEAWPEAEVFVAPGLPEKCKDLPDHQVLGDASPPAWAGELEQLFVPGVPILNEVVFFHPRSRTLLLTDLAFNIQHAEGFGNRLFWRLNRALGRFGPTRLMRLNHRDRAATRTAIDRILEWDFDRVSVTHGELLETGGREALRAGWAWL